MLKPLPHRSILDHSLGRRPKIPHPNKDNLPKNHLDRCFKSIMSLSAESILFIPVQHLLIILPPLLLSLRDRIPHQGGRFASNDGIESQ